MLVGRRILPDGVELSPSQDSLYLRLGSFQSETDHTFHLHRGW